MTEKSLLGTGFDSINSSMELVLVGISGEHQYFEHLLHFLSYLSFYLWPL